MSRWVGGKSLPWSTATGARFALCLCFLAAGWNPLPTWAEDRAADPISVVVAGDVMLDGGPGHAVVHGENPFAQFDSLFRSADISLCNLECVVTEKGRQVLKPYTFQAPPCCLPLLKRYFSAVSLANNHSGDFGREGLAEELRLLAEIGLPYFGAGRNQKQARAPLVLERRGRRVALLAYNDFPPRSFEAGPKKPGIAWLIPAQCMAEVKAARTEYHADIVIPCLHWGEEGKPGPEESQRTLARQLIDAGADAIVGNHSHCTQTVEIYKGRPIIYSLGNFVFDYYPVDPAVFTGWVVRLTFRHPADVELETFVVEIDRTGLPHMSPANSTPPSESTAHGPPCPRDAEKP